MPIEDKCQRLTRVTVKVTPNVMELIEKQPGKDFDEKFRLLVYTCFDLVDQKRFDYMCLRNSCDSIQQRIEEKEKELRQITIQAAKKAQLLRTFRLKRRDEK